MIDHLLGRPAGAVYKRIQVTLVVLFWTLALLKGDRRGPPLLRRLLRPASRLSPWQTFVVVMTALYTIKNSDSFLGLSAPEPMARLYSRDFYRATWCATALDTGFATAMTIKPKWLRDIMSILFSGYYLIFANAADEKLRKYRAVCSIEMLRATWEKTSNPYIRFFTAAQRPRIKIVKKVYLPRPSGSPYAKPIIAYLYFDGTPEELSRTNELILDIPGGGFVCMTPKHHEERLLRWTKRTNRPVLSVDYSKAPEFPYPFAMHECFDVYRLLHETKGAVIGMSTGKELRIVVTGDSAGANLAAAMTIKIIEFPEASRPPLPVSMVSVYPVFDFNFTSFMPPENMRILRSESKAALPSIIHQKDHIAHRSPLTMVDDTRKKRSRSTIRKRMSRSFASIKTVAKSPGMVLSGRDPFEAAGHEADNEDEDEDSSSLADEEKSISDRVKFWNPDYKYQQLALEKKANMINERISLKATALDTKLTMTSRTGFFNDRIIPPSMLRAMALCYVGPHAAPDLSKNYLISPLLAPYEVLAKFPPVYLLCGERDPLSDDTLLFAGRLREAKLSRQAEVRAKRQSSGKLNSLHMSNSRIPEDPIVDEDETDWCMMRVVPGWSHGFLQMVTLLPAVEQFLELTADWCTMSFERQDIVERKRRKKEMVDSTDDSEGDILTFTPRKRRPDSFDSPRPGGSPSPSFGNTVGSSLKESYLPQMSPTSAKAGMNGSAVNSDSEESRSSGHQTIKPEDAKPSGIRKLSGNTSRASGQATPTFMEASDMLRKRREETAFGLQAGPHVDEHTDDRGSLYAS